MSTSSHTPDDKMHRYLQRIEKLVGHRAKSPALSKSRNKSPLSIKTPRVDNYLKYELFYKTLVKFFQNKQKNIKFHFLNQLTGLQLIKNQPHQLPSKVRLTQRTNKSSEAILIFKFMLIRICDHQLRTGFQSIKQESQLLGQQHLKRISAHRRTYSEIYAQSVSKSRKKSPSNIYNNQPKTHQLTKSQSERKKLLQSKIIFLSLQKILLARIHSVFSKFRLQSFKAITFQPSDLQQSNQLKRKLQLATKQQSQLTNLKISLQKTQQLGKKQLELAYKKISQLQKELDQSKEQLQPLRKQLQAAKKSFEICQNQIKFKIKQNQAIQTQLNSERQSIQIQKKKLQTQKRQLSSRKEQLKIKGKQSESKDKQQLRSALIAKCIFLNKVIKLLVNSRKNCFLKKLSEKPFMNSETPMNHKNQAASIKISSLRSSKQSASNISRASSNFDIFASKINKALELKESLHRIYSYSFQKIDYTAFMYLSVSKPLQNLLKIKLTQSFRKILFFSFSQSQRKSHYKEQDRLQLKNKKKQKAFLSLKKIDSKLLLTKIQAYSLIKLNNELNKSSKISHQSIISENQLKREIKDFLQQRNKMYEKTHISWQKTKQMLQSTEFLCSSSKVSV